MVTSLKSIILKKMIIEHFKGIKNLDIELSASLTNIYGDNATGKTTIFDAFTWLFFDKDSHNSKLFNIKPLSEAGDVAQRGVEPTITAFLEIEGQDIELKKSYAEKWTKKKGSADKVFDGHETKHFIDGVPKKKSEYDAYVKGIADESLFRLLTDVLHFNTGIGWQDRRKMLLDICGDISDDEVMYNNEMLRELPELMGKHSIEDFRKILSSRRREINKALEELPARIDEANRAIVEGIDEDTEREAIEHLNNSIALAETGKELLGTSDALAGEIRELEMKRMELNNKNEQYKLQKRTEYNNQNLELEQKRSELKAMVAAAAQEIEAKKSALKVAEGQRLEANEQYHAVFAEEWTGERVCPTCGQDMPSDTIALAEADFNEKKAKRLEAIRTKGFELKASIESLTIALEGTIAKKGLEASYAHLTAELVDMPAPEPFVPTDMPEYSGEMLAINDLLRAKHEEQQSGTVDVKAKLAEQNAKIAELKDELRLHQGRLVSLENNKRQRERITELEAQEKKLAAELEETEHSEYLTDEFTKEKVNMLEERINSRFSLTRFKLFDVQINGGISECCEAMYSGVPYADLNNAMKINVGLDIINALAAHYDVCAPVFIDNAESVTQLAGCIGQVIRLVVSEQDKALRIEALSDGKAVA